MAKSTRQNAKKEALAVISSARKWLYKQRFFANMTTLVGLRYNHRLGYDTQLFTARKRWRVLPGAAFVENSRGCA